MERQRNLLRHAVKNNSILPIEYEMLCFVCEKIEKSTKSTVSYKEKIDSQPLYDSYLIVANDKPYVLKINLSPDLPNFWNELCLNNFDFHPKIIAYSKEEDDYKFICYEMPKGIFASDISNYILAPKLNLQKKLASSLKKMHQVKLSDKDNTSQILDSMLPAEASLIWNKYPAVELFSEVKVIFNQIYPRSTERLGVCHFNLTGDSLIDTSDEFKFIDFEYSANANNIIDLLLAKETLSASDQSFDIFLQFYGINKQEIKPYLDSSDLFCFAYFNSKIVAEYMTFGMRDPIKLKLLINKAGDIYERIKDKLFVSKTLDKNITYIYNLWKS
jgi:thiamine kinase-like enzyme